MNKELFNNKTKFENDTYYYIEEKEIHIYLKDTTPLYDKKYFCTDGTVSNKHDTVFFLKGLKNVTLDFCGATLILHGPIQPFIIDECLNVEIKNVAVKYTRSFVTEMKILDRGEDYIRVKIGKEFPYKVENGEFIPYGEEWEDRTVSISPLFLQEFDGKTREGIIWPVVVLGGDTSRVFSQPWGGNVPVLGVEEEKDGTLVFRSKDMPNYSVGNILALAPANRDISSSTIINSKNIYLTNYRVINGTGMGILTFYVENLYLDHLIFTYDKKSIGIITNSADGIHAVALKGELILKDCIIEGTIDDALNIHSNFFGFEKGEGKKLYAKKIGHMNDDDRLFWNGDKILIHRGHSLENVTEYIIEKVEYIGDSRYIFTVDREVENHTEGDLIENMSTKVNVTIKNCRFGKSNTHLRFQTRGDILIEDCETEMDFILTGDTNYWFESSPVDNMVIRNVKFLRKEGGFMSIPEFKATEKAPYYHGKVSITNCLFRSKEPVYIRFLRELEFLYNINENREEMIIKADKCGEIKVSDGVIVNNVDEKLSSDE